MIVFYILIFNKKYTPFKINQKWIHWINFLSSVWSLRDYKTNTWALKLEAHN